MPSKNKNGKDTTVAVNMDSGHQDTFSTNICALTNNYVFYKSENTTCVGKKSGVLEKLIQEEDEEFEGEDWYENEYKENIKVIEEGNENENKRIRIEKNYQVVNCLFKT